LGQKATKPTNERHKIHFIVPIGLSPNARFTPSSK